MCSVVIPFAKPSLGRTGPGPFPARASLPYFLEFFEESAVPAGDKTLKGRPQFSESYRTRNFLKKSAKNCQPHQLMETSLFGC
jgi:hypothetical protein